MVIRHDDVILAGDAWEEFLWWIRERIYISIQKRMGAPEPWTPDVTLQRYKFGHVHRRDDRGTVYELKKLKELEGDRVRQLQFVLVYRHNIIPWVTEALLRGETPEYITENAKGRAVMHDCIKVWPGIWVGDGEYFSLVDGKGMRPVRNIEDLPLEYWATYCHLHALDVLTEENYEQHYRWLVQLALDPKGLYPDPSALWDDVRRRFTRLGDFKAYEVMTSWTYLPWWPWDEDSFVYVGAGAAPAIRFLDRHAEPAHDKSWIVRHAPSIREELIRRGTLPKGGHFTARTLEDCLCEYRKWKTVKDGTRLPRPREDTLGRWSNL